MISLTVTFLGIVCLATFSLFYERSLDDLNQNLPGDNSSYTTGSSDSDDIPSANR